MPRTKNIEVTQRHRLQPIHFPIAAQIQLAQQFLHCIRRKRPRQHSFHLRQRIAIAIRGRRRRIHNPLDAAMARAFQQIESSVDVCRVAGARILHRQRHRRNRALVKNNVDALAGFRNPILIAQIDLENLNVVLPRRQVLTLSRGKIIQSANRLASFNKCLRQPGTDESSSSCHQIGGHISPSRRGVALGFAAESSTQGTIIATEVSLFGESRTLLRGTSVMVQIPSTTAGA